MGKVKNYSNAPLPFMGQKRRFLKDLKEVLNDFNSDAIYVDLFGGSGLLSHSIKSFYPSAKVVYNDFDNYFERLTNIPRTNALLAIIRSILISEPKDKKVNDVLKQKIFEVVESESLKGFVDFITLSSSLLFSMNYVTSLSDFKKSTIYNCVRTNDYNADGYLDGVERVSLDYKELYNKYKDNVNVVFMVDPPYLSTEVGTYTGYWKLKDYLDVLQVLKEHPYVYFTSNKSSIIELCEWIGNATLLANPFNGATTRTANVTMNYNSTYTDIMIYKGLSK